MEGQRNETKCDIDHTNGKVSSTKSIAFKGMLMLRGGRSKVSYIGEANIIRRQYAMAVDLMRSGSGSNVDFHVWFLQPVRV